MALLAGDKLEIYMATGKRKHPRVFWIEMKGRCVCWGKNRCEHTERHKKQQPPRNSDPLSCLRYTGEPAGSLFRCGADCSEWLCTGMPRSSSGRR